MKTLTTAFLFLAALFPAISASAYDFCKENEDGKMIYYNILSEDEKTCEVTAKEIRHSWGSSYNFKDYEGEIYIPSIANGYTVTGIGENAFLCNKNVTSVTLPNTITRIDYYAFTACKGLTSVTLGNSVT